MKAFRNWRTFRGESRVKTWLTTITIHTCRDKLGLKMRSEQPTDPSLLHQTALQNVEQEVMEKLDQTTILKHIAKLPAPYQEVIFLYYYLDLGTREAAEALSILAYIPAPYALHEINVTRQASGETTQAGISYAAGDESFGILANKEQPMDDWPPEGRRVRINGQAGGVLVALEPDPYSGPGGVEVYHELHWSMNGVWYTKAGSLSEEQILSVAESMKPMKTSTRK